MHQISIKGGIRRFGICAASVALAASMMIPGLASADPSAAELREQAEAEQQATEELEEAAAAAQQRAEEAGDADALQAQANEALGRLNAMAETLDRTSADYFEALKAQENAEAKRDKAAQKIEELKEQINEVQGDLSKRARSMYRNGTSGMVDLILGAESFEELANNWSILSRMNDADAALIGRATDLKAKTEEQHEIYEREATIAAAKSEEAAAAKAEAEATAAAYQAEYDGLSAQAAEALEAAREAEELAQEAEAQRVVQASAEQAAAAAEQREAEEEAARQAAEAAAAAQAAAEAEAAEEEAPSSAYAESAGDTEEEAASAPAAEPSYEGGSDAVSRAYSCMGLPYVWGATGPGSYDCSGLVGYCITGSHARLGTTYTFMGYPQVSNPQPGDICTSWSHCGIYIGNGQMIHAPQSGDVVKIGPVQSGMIIVRYPG
ncbi:MAG: NlpC/P60 family protein [Coriobacteriia bacterium]|nr:NlpC/P60 family protein [Coriobacteriia bacterium]